MRMRSEQDPILLKAAFPTARAGAGSSAGGDPYLTVCGRSLPFDTPMIPCRRWALSSCNFDCCYAAVWPLYISVGPVK